MPVLDGDFEAFVTNLGKYNEGMLVGEWVKLPTTEEEMQKVFERIGIGKQDDSVSPTKSGLSLTTNARSTVFRRCLASTRALISSTISPL
jgi:Antirestriction protein (ArdA)